MKLMKWILLGLIYPFVSFSQGLDLISLAGEWRFALMDAFSSEKIMVGGVALLPAEI